MVKTSADREPEADAETDGRRRRGARSRALVLTRAMDVASTHGLEGLTIGALAHDLGISKGNIVVLFGDKQTLQIETLDAAVDVFVEHVVAPNLRPASPLQRLERICAAWYDYVEQRIFPGGCMLYATTNEYRARPGAIRDRVNHHRDAWTRLLTGAARAAVASGELDRATDTDQLVFELTAFQSAANTATLLGDQVQFERARRTTETRLAEARR